MTNFLTNEHEQLGREQQSSFMQWFGQLPFDRKIAAIGVSLTIGVTCAASSWTGEASNRVYFCIRTPQNELRCVDKNNRPYRMTLWHWQQWKKDGMPTAVVPNQGISPKGLVNELRCVDKNNRPYRMTLWHWQQWKKDGMPTAVVPNQGISPKGLVKATNPHKLLWAVGAFVGFAAAGWMLRHLQDNERKLTNFQTVAEKRDIARAELKAQSELMDDYREVAIKQVELQTSLDIIANEGVVDIQKAEILGETEIKITQMEANDAVFEAETAGMSSEQKALYINFLRQQKTPYLQGTQTLQGTVNPGDKVEGSGDKAAFAAGDEQPLASGNIAGDENSETNQKQPTDTISPTLEPLNRILGAKRSTLIVGGTGAGKSVTESYMLTKFFQRFSNALVWAIAQKNDSFCGLDKKGRVLLFDPLESQPAFQAIDQVYNIYDQRRRVPEYRRHEFDNQPVRLILADWHSIYETVKDEQWFQPYLKKISTIITVGRELNVCLIIDTQSFNLAALGIGDSNIRKNLYIIAQGNYNVESDGTVNDSYGVLYNLITNAKIVESAELRLQLKERFNELKPQSKQLGQPLIFISVDPMQLNILPDITSYKPGQTPAIKLDTISPEYLNNLLKLEFDIDKAPTNNFASEQTQESSIKLTEIQVKLIDYLKGKDAKTPRQIKQNAAKLFKGISEQTIRDELNQLVQQKRVICSGEDSYRLVE